MSEYPKYRPADPVEIENRQWPSRRITTPPVWASVDLRDGNQAFIRPMNAEAKLRYFQMLAHIGFREIEVGYPASSREEFEFLRQLIGEGAIPDDVRICVLTAARPDLIERTVRDFLTEQTDRILIDSKEDYDRIMRSVSEISRRARSKIQLFKENIPIFERYNIERQIAQTFQRRVPLPSGGEIVIDETEALVAIDVNTGSHKGKSDDGKDFILQANLEAVTEAARQVRLRNLGGLVIIDTIDMKSRKDRQAVYKRLKDEMEKDKAKSQVLPISQLGIMQMTRQRHAQSNSSGIYTTCPYCGGKGIVKSARTMSAEIQRKIVATCRTIRANNPNMGEISLLILLHPDNLRRLQTEDYEHLINLEKAYNLKLTFRADPSYHLENFRIMDAKK